MKIIMLIEKSTPEAESVSKNSICHSCLCMHDDILFLNSTYSSIFIVEHMKKCIRNLTHACIRKKTIFAFYFT